jgi:NitT/TauT family transport system substrate-binding protein
MALRIGHLSTFYHTAVLLMADEKTPGRLGRDIQWRLFGAGPAIVEAFEKGELDLAYIGLPPAIIGMERGVRIKCIAGGHMEGTVITGRKELGGYPEVGDLGMILGQLRGTAIGVPGRGSIHDVILADCLREFDMKEEIGVVNFKWADLIVEAIRKGEVSAAFGTPALAVAVKRYAGGKMLYPPRLLWPGNPSYGILAETAFLEETPDLAERFLTLHEDAATLLREHAGEAAGRISDFVGFIDKDFVLETIQVSPKYCAQLTGGYVSSTMAFVKALKRLGYIEREPSEDEIFDASLINKIHGHSDHYGKSL